MVRPTLPDAQPSTSLREENNTTIELTDKFDFETSDRSMFRRPGWPSAPLKALAGGTAFAHIFAGPSLV